MDGLGHIVECADLGNARISEPQAVKEREHLSGERCTNNFGASHRSTTEFALARETTRSIDDSVT